MTKKEINKLRNDIFDIVDRLLDMRTSLTEQQTTPPPQSNGGELMAALIAMLSAIPLNPESTALNPKQHRHVLMTAILIIYANLNGYRLSWGSARSAPGNTPAHSAKSLHFDSLAIDLNLFKDGAYLSKTEDHEPLGLFWESIGGAWGGRFNDGNHYSIEHNGRK